MGVIHTKVQPGGRLLIPAELRRELGLDAGSSVVLDRVNGALRVRSMAQVVRDVQAMAAPYRRCGVSVVDDFIAERRAEAEAHDA